MNSNSNENKEKKYSKSTLGESFDQLFQEENFKQINEVLKNSAQGLLDVTQKGIEYVNDRWGKKKKPLRPIQNPALVDQEAASMKHAKAMHNTGKALLTSHGILGLVFAFSAVTGGILVFPFFLFWIIPVLIVGFIMTKMGKIKYNKKVRLRKYLRELGTSTVATVEDLALAANQSIPNTREELKELISADVFRQGRLIEEEKIFVLDRETFRVYKDQYKTSLATEEKKSLEENVELKDVYERGKEQMATLLGLSQSLDGKAREKVDQLMSTIAAIFENVKEHPENGDSLGKFMDYYMPTTISLVERYVNFESKESGENAKMAMEDILESLDTINDGFAALLNNLQGEIARDVQADISVLKAMLKQEGLLGKDFDMEE